MHIYTPVDTAMCTYSVIRKIYIFLCVFYGVLHMSRASATPDGANIKMSSILQDTSMGTSATSVPMHIANLLKLISLQDKFNKVFVKWSLLSKPDRDILVLTLKPGGSDRQ